MAARIGEWFAKQQARRRRDFIAGLGAAAWPSMAGRSRASGHGASEHCIAGFASVAGDAGRGIIIDS
jgi:hypothetical protein